LTSILYQGEVEMRLELDDIGVYVSRNPEESISQSEKMTQTDLEFLNSDRFYRTTPNGTSPCNHPSLSCQVRK
jgi:hypothetical protein